MEFKLVSEPEFCLRINEDEARWLLGMCQNSLQSEETSKDEKIRSWFFHILAELLNR